MSDAQEEQRQRIIARYGLGEGDEDAFNQFSGTVASIFGVPIALVTVLRRERQVFQGVCGLATGGCARESAFCTHTVRQASVMVVEDATLDPRFARHELVIGEPYLRFYAGAPITVDGVAIGALCVLDHQPRPFSADSQALLIKLAETAASLIKASLDAVVVAARERELRQQTQLLRVMLDNVDQGIAYFDRDLRLTLWNDRFFELHGFDDEMKRSGLPAEAMLRTSVEWGMFGPEVTSADVPRMLEIIRDTPESQTVVETREGRTLHSVRLRIGDGSGFIVAVRDLTAERIATRTKDEFVSTVSHELRTPLTAIRGALALLGTTLGETRTPRAQQMFDMAQKNAVRLNSLIDDILDIERLTRGQTGYVLLPLDVRDVIADAVQQNEPFAESLDVRLIAAASEKMMLRGDPGRLMQVLTNLLSNAVRHSPAGTQVSVGAHRRERTIRVEVRDQGSGVPENFVDRLFERFSQAADSKRRGNGGTGLGLAISQAIVEQHGGTIGYEPQPVGSCFWMELPAS